jgi:ElaB/YqjD/DUF883 family membrane-anchored ribosome-binding protein
VSIVETRSQLSETLDEIEGRLSPEHIKEQARETVAELTRQAKEAIREATIGRAETALDEVVDTTRGVGMTMLDTIKQNPIPAALIGIGVGWLLMKGQGGGANDRRYGYSPRGTSRLDPQGRLWMDEYNGYGPMERGAGDVSDAGLTDRLQDTAGQAVGQVQDVAGRMAGNLQDTVSGFGQTTQAFTETAQERIQRVMHDSPLMVGGVAMAAGMIVGLALPETERESEIFGEARDSLIEQVKETAREAQERVQDAVGQAAAPTQSGAH